MTVTDIEHILDKYLNEEIHVDTNQIANAIYDQYKASTEDDVNVDIELLKEAYNAVVKLKSFINNTSPTILEDVILINELGVLEFKLNDIIKANDY